MLWCLSQLYQAYFGNPLKVTDPSSRWFDARDFNVLDYPTITKQQDAFAKLFPRGTDISYVNFIMFNAGGRPNPYTQPGLVRYEFKQNLRYLEGWFVIFTFNRNGKVLNIRPLGGDEVFSQAED